MITWLKHFFMIERYFLGVVRLLAVAAGTGIASGDIPIPEGWSWLGFFINFAAAWGTGNAKNRKNGENNDK